MILAVDPGHPTYSGDLGTTAPGLTEHKYVWETANSLVAHLHHCMPSIKPVLLRRSVGEVVSLRERGERSREAGADMVLSLHVDAAEATRLRRSTAYHWPGNEEGAEVAETIVRSMPSPLHRRRGGVFATRTHSPADTWLADARAVVEAHEVTVVLVELGYCTNNRDLVALLDGATQTGIQLALMTGIVRLRQLREKKV